MKFVPKQVPHTLPVASLWLFPAASTASIHSIATQSPVESVAFWCQCSMTLTLIRLDCPSLRSAEHSAVLAVWCTPVAPCTLSPSISAGLTCSGFASWEQLVVSAQSEWYPCEADSFPWRPRPTRPNSAWSPSSVIRLSPELWICILLLSLAFGSKGGTNTTKCSPGFGRFWACGSDWCWASRSACWLCWGPPTSAPPPTTSGCCSRVLRWVSKRHRASCSTAMQLARCRSPSPLC